MLKVCSLDFLNSDVFEVDIKTSDGEILYNSGDKITPEILLKLYFKEIYIEEAQVVSLEKETEKIPESVKLEESKTEEEVIVTVSTETEQQPEQIDEAIMTESESIPEGEGEGELVVGKFEESEIEVKSEIEPEEPEEIQITAEIEQTESEETILDVEPELSKEPESETRQEDEEITKSEKGPKVASLNFDEDSVEENESQKGPKPADIVDITQEEEDNIISASMINNAQESKKGPKKADFDFDEDENKLEEKNSQKGPKFAGINLAEEEELESEEPPPIIEEEPVEEVPEIPLEERQLEFNEEKAKKIVEYATQIGQKLGYSTKELKELEQAAYYSNIGIKNFKRKDLLNQEFTKMKILASYQELLDSEIVPTEIAEIIKFCAYNYQSDTFALDSKIPYHHVISVITHYDDLLEQTNSKEATLLKMLQMGGNKFNIFVLHKFIGIMRDN